MGKGLSLKNFLIRLGLLTLLLAFVIMSWPLLQERYLLTENPGNSSVANPFPAQQVAASLPTPTPTLDPAAPNQLPGLNLPVSQIQLEDGILVLAVREGLYTRLFVYHPTSLDLMRLTYGNWDDQSPSINPDQTQIAFSSNRDGQWDLYLLTIQTGEITRITDTPEYDGNPSWSPDGLWIAYDTYLDNSLDIMIRPINGDQEPIRLTDDLSADYDPAWSPGGRQIAFVSTRSGEREIWVADLDQVAGRFTNLSQTSQRHESNPVWAASGEQLLWSGIENGTSSLYAWNINQPLNSVVAVGIGDLGDWAPDSTQVVARISLPNQNLLTTYSLSQNRLFLPPFTLPGTLQGMDWGDFSLPESLPPPIAEAVKASPPELWKETVKHSEELLEGRGNLVSLSDVEAPYALLQDNVDDSFQEMRSQLAEMIGWDFLYTLENAFIPLSTPALPSLDGSWLYTGRGIAVNTVPINAGWMAVAREDFGSQTYWRVFLRTRLQDGSQGKPLSKPTWNFAARYTGDPLGYEQGGLEVSNPPTGYWFDFTEFAHAFNWERMPSSSAWRSFYPATRLNEYAFTEGLDWRRAILEIYPPEMLITPTPVSSPTITPTPTITNKPTKYPTRTPRPTNTPWPTRTSTPTQTSTITLTPTPTGTSSPTPQSR
jgi:TolB protein